MFTGIVDHTAVLEEVEQREGFARLAIASRFDGLALGESIAVDGCCLTVVSFEGGRFVVELSTETLQRTTSGGYRQGQRVNVERALRLGDRLGGHFVTGHVDATGVLVSREAIAGCTRYHFRGVTDAYRSYVLEKGSITVDGISLTLNEVFDDGFAVMVIPHTAERTTIDARQPGDRVNLEFDWMTKVILTDARARRELLEKKNDPA